MVGASAWKQDMPPIGLVLSGWMSDREYGRSELPQEGVPCCGDRRVIAGGGGGGEDVVSLLCGDQRVMVGTGGADDAVDVVSCPCLSSPLDASQRGVSDNAHLSASLLSSVDDA